MKEYPILFNGPMVRAILDGRKTQTRRVIKNPSQLQGKMLEGEEGEWCPYGGPGDRLWVRERLQNWHGQAMYYRYNWADCTLVNPQLDWRWKRNTISSMFMPKVAVRIWLEITGVRVERVQEISEEDALAEGVETNRGNGGKCRRDFAMLWDSINAKRGFDWDVNPWVWVVEFRRIKP